METTVQAAWKDFSSHVFNFIHSKVKVREDAEDILQDVFLRIQLNISQLHNDQNLKPWVFQIARNAMNDYWKNLSLKRNAEGSPEMQQVDVEPDIADKYIDKCIVRLIDTLPVKYREAIKESEINGKKQTELAEQLGISYSTLKSRVQRGREMLKQSLADCCNFQINEKHQLVSGNSSDSCTC